MGKEKTLKECLEDLDKAAAEFGKACAAEVEKNIHIIKDFTKWMKFTGR